MEDLKRVYITQDDDDNYVIPYEMKDDFISMASKIKYEFWSLEYQSGVNGEKFSKAVKDFDDKFSQYTTVGDINLIELYARI